MTEKNFEIERSFGVGVLLKLTKKNVTGIQVTSHGDKFVSNVDRATMTDAVESTMKSHGINLKYK